jgi:hypothetical protein
MATLDTATKEAFWGVVEDCLVRFHGWTCEATRRRLATLREDLEARPSDMAREIIYHHEPFNLACIIAGRELALDDVADDYDAILTRHGW